MNEKLKQTIKEEIEKLPEENREAITSLRWEEIVESIGKKLSLEENKITDLQTETLLVLIGLEKPDLYQENIENNADIDEKMAGEIADDVFKKIFDPINNILLEKIKKSEKVKAADHEQNLNFVLSGGDYSVFAEKPKTVDAESPKENQTANPTTAKTTTEKPAVTSAVDGIVKPTQQKENPKSGYTVDPYRMKPE